jgi:predicted amidohydrolase
MRIALAQAAGTPGDVAANLADVRRFAGEAAEREARLLVLPECFLTGYNIGAERLTALAEAPEGPAEHELRAISADTGVAVVCGTAQRDGDVVRNVAVFADRGTTLVTAEKSHLFGEVDRSAFAAADGLPAVAEVDGIPVGILICFDVEFPEAARALALRGAQLIAVPTSLMAPAHVVAEVLVPARAVENQIFVAYANRVGREGELRYVGRSCVAGPNGLLVAAGGDENQLLIVDLDFTAIDHSRASHHYLSERRPAVYEAERPAPTGLPET